MSPTASQKNEFETLESAQMKINMQIRTAAVCSYVVASLNV